VEIAGDAVRIATQRGRLEFDFVIFATGAAVSLESRPELAAFLPHIARWRERYAPPPQLAHPFLGDYPYLGTGYQLVERTPGAAPFLSRIHAFSFAAYVSMGPHSTSASALKHSAPRLAGAISRAFLHEQQDTILGTLRAYDEIELRLGPDPFDQTLRKPG
jgi:cation diffusion facilitator CzcD-associated flavoprotein CzcO